VKELQASPRKREKTYRLVWERARKGPKSPTSQYPSGVVYSRGERLSSGRKKGEF